MTQLLLKGLISGAIVVAASELARRSTVFAAVVVSLPLTSILAICWLYADTRDVEQVAAFSWSVLWVVLPSIVFFVALPLLLRSGLPFVASLALSCAVMALGYAGYVVTLRALGVQA